MANFVWNYCNDAQQHAVKWDQPWPTHFSLTYATSGTSKELEIPADSIGAICAGYVSSRCGRERLRYRGPKSLGWVPIRVKTIKVLSDGFKFGGHTFRVFNLGLPLEGKVCDGSTFSQDARGNWYLNICIEVTDAETRAPVRTVGIDLGLKDFAALSTGEKIPNPGHFRALETKLATAQRARHKRQARNIHAKIADRRKDALHKLSHRLTTEFDFIAVGNVSSSKLAKTKMAKSVYDVSWSTFRNMLAYKSIRNGAGYSEVSERFTSQVCSSCGCLPDSRPNGIADLGVRHWVCSDCGASHDRDVNAALNILARAGHRSPVVGIAAVRRECQLDTNAPHSITIQ